MTTPGRDQSIGLSWFRARRLEEYQLRFVLRVFSFECTWVAQDHGANFFQHSHRADVTGAHVHDHDLFRTNTQLHDSSLRQLGLRREHTEGQETDRYQMHQTQTFVHLTSLFAVVFLLSDSAPASRR